MRQGGGKMWGRIQRFINNQKIKKKIIYLYVFCVLVPVLVTNTFVIKLFIDAARVDKERNMDHMVETVAQYLLDAIESAQYLSYDIYSSYPMNEFLDTRYKDSIEYFDRYRQMFENYTFYTGSRLIISDVTLYSENNTMTNGGRYYSVASVREELWYQELQQTEGDMLVFPYYADKKDMEQRERMLSFVRRLDYWGKSGAEKIVKLDMNYDKINEYIMEAAENTLVYICHGDKLLFTTDKRYGNSKTDYYDKAVLEFEDIQRTGSYSLCGFEFDVYLKGYQFSYAEVLLNNLGGVGLLFMANVMLPVIIITLWSNSITSRVLLVGSYLNKVRDERFEVIEGVEEQDEIGQLERDYNLMVTKIKNLLEIEIKSKLEKQELDIARQQAELLALQSQINPHFLFNVLESIRLHSVLKGEAETAHMLESLAKIMRKSAEWGSDLITLRQELAYAEAYLQLQKYRFGEGFHYRFKIAGECYEFQIPSLVVVTFIENSCVHGLNREDHCGAIFVSAYKEDACVIIEIEDTGVGIEEERRQNLEEMLNKADMDKLQGSSALGMLNACVRLKKIYGNNVKIKIESEEQVGTCIVIKIPENSRNR